MPTACALWRSPLFQQEAATSPFYVVALAPALTLSRGPALFCFTTKDHTPTGVWSFFILPGVFVHTRSFGIWGAGCSTKALFIRGFSSRDAGACSFFCASGLRRRTNDFLHHIPERQALGFRQLAVVLKNLPFQRGQILLLSQGVQTIRAFRQEHLPGAIQQPFPADVKLLADQNCV